MVRPWLERRANGEWSFSSFFFFYFVVWLKLFPPDVAYTGGRVLLLSTLLVIIGVSQGEEADLLNTTPAVSMVMSSVIHGVSKRYDSLITSPVLIIA